MAKKAIYYDEAQRLFVTQGFALDTIAGMLEDNVTRRTLHNWMEDGDWRDKRKRYLAQHESLSDMVMQIAKSAAQRALADPNPKNLLSLVRAINALKEKDALAMFAHATSEEDESTPAEDVTRLVRQAVKEVLGA